MSIVHVLVVVLLESSKRTRNTTQPQWGKNTHQVKIAVIIKVIIDIIIDIGGHRHDIIIPQLNVCRVQ